MALCTGAGWHDESLSPAVGCCPGAPLTNCLWPTTCVKEAHALLVLCVNIFLMFILSYKVMHLQSEAPG